MSGGASVRSRIVAGGVPARSRRATVTSRITWPRPTLLAAYISTRGPAAGSRVARGRTVQPSCCKTDASTGSLSSPAARRVAREPAGAVLRAPRSADRRRPRERPPMVSLLSSLRGIGISPRQHLLDVGNGGIPEEIRTTPPFSWIIVMAASTALPRFSSRAGLLPKHRLDVRPHVLVGIEVGLVAGQEVEAQPRAVPVHEP